MISAPALDLLIRIKNGYLASLKSIKAPGSKFNQALCQLLLENNYISSFDIQEDGVKKSLSIKLKYTNKEPSLHGVRIYSRPGRRIYERVDSLPWGKSKASLIIISTSLGLKSQKDAKKLNVGGEVIAEIY